MNTARTRRNRAKLKEHLRVTKLESVVESLSGDVKRFQSSIIILDAEMSIVKRKFEESKESISPCQFIIIEIDKRLKNLEGSCEFLRLKAETARDDIDKIEEAEYAKDKNNEKLTIRMDVLENVCKGISKRVATIGTPTITTPPATEKPKRWKPKDGDFYYVGSYYSSSGARSNIWKNSEYDNFNYKCGNVHRTAPEARTWYDKWIERMKQEAGE